MRIPSRTTRLTLFAAAIGLVVVACVAPSEPIISGACIGITNIQGVNYILDAELTASERLFHQEEELGSVTRLRRCNDTPPTMMGLRMWSADEVPFEAGDSNMLEVGTKICAILGESPENLVMLCGRPPSDKRILRAHYVRDLTL